MDTKTAKIIVKGEAVNWLNAQPKNVRQHIIDMIREKAQHPTDQMVVTGMTFDLPDHIFRAMKSYVFKPGIRVIFYITTAGVCVTRIAWRCDDPYGDSH